MPGQRALWDIGSQDAENARLAATYQRSQFRPHSGTAMGNKIDALAQCLLKGIDYSPGAKEEPILTFNRQISTPQTAPSSPTKQRMKNSSVGFTYQDSGHTSLHSETKARGSTFSSPFTQKGSNLEGQTALIRQSFDTRAPPSKVT